VQWRVSGKKTKLAVFPALYIKVQFSAGNTTDLVSIAHGILSIEKYFMKSVEPMKKKCSFKNNLPPRSYLE
jgi:hypothetical protein